MARQCSPVQNHRFSLRFAASPTTLDKNENANDINNAFVSSMSSRFLFKLKLFAKGLSLCHQLNPRNIRSVTINHNNASFVQFCLLS